MPAVTHSLRANLQLIISLVRLLVSRPDMRARRLYEFYQVFDLPGQLAITSSYMNFGYWEPGCDDLEEAGNAMADVLADAAALKPGDRILDAGFGNGDQDFYWASTRSPAQIVGVDVTPVHVRTARERAERLHLSDILSFRAGSATSLEYEADSFDKVVALESAFHFITREEFFREAYRVLKKGGTLATADVVPLPGGENIRGNDPVSRSVQKMIRKSNWYFADDYAERLARAGFVNINIRSIRDHVFEPYRRYFAKRILDPALQLNGLRGFMVKQGRRQVLGESRRSAVDYIIAVAEKPASP